MKYLDHLISELGEYLKRDMGTSGNIGTLARRMQKDGVMHYVDSQGNILHPVNDADLKGFHYFPTSTPVYDNYACTDRIQGWNAKGYGIFYGQSDCGWGEADKLAYNLSKFRFDNEEISAKIKPSMIVVEMPKLINELFPWMKEQAQAAQPCTFLWKIDYTINIKVNGRF